MSFIKRMPKTIFTIHCTHPMVERIWEYGGLAEIPTSAEAKRYLCIMLKNDQHEIVSFEDNGSGKAIEKAEKFLENL